MFNIFSTSANLTQLTNAFINYCVFVAFVDYLVFITKELISDERPYKCHLPNCGRAFIQLSNLQQHLRNHDGQLKKAANRLHSLISM